MWHSWVTFSFLLKFADFVTRLSESGYCYRRCEARLILYFLLELTCFFLELTCFFLDAWIALVLSVICNRLIKMTVLIITFFFLIWWFVLIYRFIIFSFKEMVLCDNSGFLFWPIVSGDTNFSFVGLLYLSSILMLCFPFALISSLPFSYVFIIIILHFLIILLIWFLASTFFCFCF